MLQSTFAFSHEGTGQIHAPAQPRASESVDPGVPVPLHVGIIMDGNGRWARRRGLPRSAGHRAGAPAVRRIVAAASGHGIGVLTLYAFSSDNWRRPPLEVGNLMRLFGAYLRSEADRCADEGIRVSVIGCRSRLPRALVDQIETIEARTRAGRTLHLRIAIDYSSRDAIVEAVLGAATHTLRRPGETLARKGPGSLVSRGVHGATPMLDVDLVIRTGGEQRLSDFLLWESAYAELVFSACLWPDFHEQQLAAAMAQFRERERRYGGLQPQRAHTAAEG